MHCYYCFVDSVGDERLTNVTMTAVVMGIRDVVDRIAPSGGEGVVVPAHRKADGTDPQTLLTVDGSQGNTHRASKVA